MSAYSDKDLQQAFRCAERGDWSNAIEAVEGRVMAHLNSTCSCDVGRCNNCGMRDTNNVPRHKADCPMAGGR